MAANTTSSINETVRASTGLIKSVQQMRRGELQQFAARSHLTALQL